MISDPVQARAVSESAEAFVRALSHAFEAARTTMPPTEFERLKVAVGNVIGIMEVDLLWPLYKLHPELEPENLRGVPGDGQAT
jgi:hypothetical protein